MLVDDKCSNSSNENEIRGERYNETMVDLQARIGPKYNWLLSSRQ